MLVSGLPVTLDQIQTALVQASPRTTFRYLDQVRHLRSYNHNARVCTDRDPSRFNRFGLTSIGDVHFSRDGSLTGTVERLLCESEGGWTDKELRTLLHVPVYPFLLAAVRQGRDRQAGPAPPSGPRDGGPAGPARLQRTNRNAELRRRNRASAADATNSRRYTRKTTSKCAQHYRSLTES